MFSGLFIAVRECGLRSKLFGFLSDRFAFVLYYSIFIAVAISEETHQLFDVARISTVSDDKLLAVVTRNILISDNGN